MPKKAKVYEYSGCSTCKNALRFLEKNGIDYVRIPIVEQPPTVAELKRMAAHYGGNIRKLFNTSGQLYREMKIGEKLAAGMTDQEALELLSKHGKLVKRPFLLGEDSALVGFKEEEWQRALL